MFNYNDIIEYEDGTYDMKLSSAIAWCKENNATCFELVDERQTKIRKVIDENSLDEQGNSIKKEETYLIRKFKLLENKKLEFSELSREQKEQDIRTIRDSYLVSTDKYMIIDFPITDEKRIMYKLYRAYLRDYTKSTNWYKNAPLSFEEWSKYNK